MYMCVSKDCQEILREKATCHYQQLQAWRQSLYCTLVSMLHRYQLHEPRSPYYSNVNFFSHNQLHLQNFTCKLEHIRSYVLKPELILSNWHSSHIRWHREQMLHLYPVILSPRRLFQISVGGVLHVQTLILEIQMRKQ